MSISRPDTTLDDVWILNVADGTRTRITFGNGDATHPVWSADGNTMYYSSNGADRVPHTYARLTNGAGEEKALLVEAGVSEVPMDVSKDGEYLAYARRENGKPWEVWMLPLLRHGSPYALARLPHADIIDPAFSPDDTWVAYSADESGTFNVYIARFHGDGKWQISAGGGTNPVWTRDGRRLYFIDNAENVMYVDVRASDVR